MLLTRKQQKVEIQVGELFFLSIYHDCEKVENQTCTATKKCFENNDNQNNIFPNDESPEGTLWRGNAESGLGKADSSTAHHITTLPAPSHITAGK